MRFQTPVQSRHSSKTSRRLELNRGVTPCSSEAGNHLRYFLEAHLVPRWAQHVELLSFHLPKHTQRELRDTHETLVCLCVFWLSDQHTFSFSCAGKQHSGFLESPSLHHNDTAAFQVLQSQWGRLDRPHDVPSQTGRQTTPSCVSALCMWQQEGNRLLRQRPVKVKVGCYEIFMTVYPQLSAEPLLPCEEHSQVTWYTPEDSDNPVNYLDSLIWNEPILLLIIWLCTPLRDVRMDSRQASVLPEIRGVDWSPQSHLMADGSHQTDCGGVFSPQGSR